MLQMNLLVFLLVVFLNAIYCVEKKVNDPSIDLNKTPPPSPQEVLQTQSEKEVNVEASKFLLEMPNPAKVKFNESAYMKNRFRHFTKEQKQKILQRKRHYYHSMSESKKEEHLLKARSRYQNMDPLEKEKLLEKGRIYRAKRKASFSPEQIQNRKITRNLKDRNKYASLPLQAKEQKRSLRNQKNREKGRKIE